MADYGFSIDGCRALHATQNNARAAWVRDFLKLLRLLKLVSNNFAATPGGPGARRWWTKVPATW